MIEMTRHVLLFPYVRKSVTIKGLWSIPAISHSLFYSVVMTRRNLILIVLRHILICSVILVCVGEDWPIVFSVHDYYHNKDEMFEFMRICDILIMALFTWRRGNPDR